MATRNASRQAASASSSPAPPRRSFLVAQPASTASPQLRELRRQWKWAAVSQFLYTFAQLVALDDVHLVDVEEDLVNSTMIVIPRLMQRLLITLTQDRKITADNWQSALRRQYLRRDPTANPIGVEPPTVRNSRAATVETEIKSEGRDSALPDDATSLGNHRREEPTDEHSGNDNGERGAIGTPQDEEASDASSLRANSVKKEDDDVSQNSQNTVKDWANLSMLEKLESIHTVIEWHFQSPSRLRSIMRSDDETATWRIEPIGYDAKRNAYWFIGADRLWIQRTPPKPPKKPRKRKAVTNADGRKAKVARVERADESKKKRSESSPETGDTPKRRGSKTAETPKRTGRASRRSLAVNDSALPSSIVSGRARAAKTQANVKLDLQAKQLAAAKAEMDSLNRKSGRNSPAKPSGQRTVGIRMSRRLRGGADDDDDEWQPIPEEWLPESERVQSKSATAAVQTTRTSTRSKGSTVTSRSVAPSGRTRISGLESDDESDLTELSDSETSTHNVLNIPEVDMPKDPPPDLNGVVARHEKDDTQGEVIRKPQYLADFIEWETLCISLQEWEEISHRFEKATHYLEKALHKVLSQEIVPFVTESLREAEKLRMKEDALMNRKRSSRIAIREMEKETARMEAVHKAEEEEKMARMRRLEARSRREEEERLKREQGREQRRKEREERELARSLRLERASSEKEVDVLTETRSDSAAKVEGKAPRNEVQKPARHRTKKKSSEKSAESETWELDCEICGARGINKDDGIPLMSCGRCNKWQHIPCHDAVDRKARRPVRNWDTVDFFCNRCRSTQNGSSQDSVYLHRPLAVNGQGRPDDRYSRAHGASDLANGIKTGQVNDNPALHQQTAGSTPFTGFAHYHPRHHGFSPSPSVLQYQYHPQPRSSTSSPSSSQSIFTHGSPVSWDSRSQGRSVDPRGSYQAVLPQHTQNGTTNGPTPSSYGVSLTGSSGSAPAQNIQHPHHYFPSSQQRLYNNPAYQPQL
ncbi:hypothetical protein A7U60_g7576 [Sanghuangporus baumii]|uniref:Zinc finger PHD-type domain-containing protein n=1 Tax=Sanghuangporus baumii TaxID=108892 RepID=A0A9Q5HSN0_SANBA|nr:hypothetical protein A7U60_g7576 [Sanghuangporus baumii]